LGGDGFEGEAAVGGDLSGLEGVSESRVFSDVAVGKVGEDGNLIILSLVITMIFSARLLRSALLGFGLMVVGPMPGFAARYIPRSQGLPGRTQGGATRIGIGERQGACQNVKNQLVALVPKDETGVTLLDYPTLGFVLPKTGPTKAEFRMRDGRFNVIYHTTFDVSGGGGVVRVTVPKDGVALAVGENYSWDFALACEEDRSADLRTSGMIQRVKTEESWVKRLKGKKMERAALLAQEGIWYDAMGSLLEMREEDPDNVGVKKEWEELVRSVGLEP
jgi:hypothetical protein